MMTAVDVVSIALTRPMFYQAVKRRRGQGTTGAVRCKQHVVDCTDHHGAVKPDKRVGEGIQCCRAGFFR
ncbi:MAG: hypothetical protein AAF334_04605, partial [Pseudomonadota bacterium]